MSKIDKFIQDNIKAEKTADKHLTNAVKENNKTTSIINAVLSFIANNSVHLGEVIKEEFTMILKAIPCSCHTKYYDEESNSHKLRTKCERCKQLEARNE